MSSRSVKSKTKKQYRWSVSKIAARAIFLGHVEAPDEATARRKAAKEFEAPYDRLLARREA